MNEEKRAEIINALANFILRVSKKEATCETEIAVLPQIADVLLKFTQI